jgi:hypothetical protein
MGLGMLLVEIFEDLDYWTASATMGGERPVDFVE